MSAPLYRRQVALEVAGLTLTKLKIQFDISRSADQTPPTGEFTIHNMAKAREQQIYEQGGPLVFKAGYPQTLATIFDGVVQKVRRTRRKDERITEIHASGKAARPSGQGQVDMKALGGISVRSYAGPAPVRQIVQDLASDMGLEVGPLDVIPADAMVEDWTWSVSSAAGMTSVLKTVGATWYEDDGVVRFNRAKAPAGTRADPGAGEITLNKDTGLIGNPAVTDDGAECVSLLIPIVRIGTKVNLKSDALSGEWRVVGLNHLGDNWTGYYRTHYDLRPL